MKLDKKFLGIMVIDFLSIAVIFSLVFLFLALINNVYEIELPNNPMDLDAKQADELSDNLKEAYHYVINLIVIFSLVLILLWSLSRATVWGLTLNKKISFMYLAKGALVGLIWYCLCLIIYILAGLIISRLPELAGIIAALVFLVSFAALFIYYSHALFFVFAKSGSCKIFKKVIRTNIIKKILFVMLGYLGCFAAITIMILLLLGIDKLIPSLSLVLIMLADIITVAAVIFYMSYARYYIVK